MDKNIIFEECGEAIARSMGLDNLAIIAPHKIKYIERYNIDWLISAIDDGADLKYTTFWKADKGCENNMLSQWYVGKPFYINGRKYLSAEQYMMSEKALLFEDYTSYQLIMAASDPAQCKSLGRGVKNFDSGKWQKAFKEIIFHGTLGKLQADIEIVDALMATDNTVLIEASPYDDIYGAGIAKEDLLNPDGSLKVSPSHWHKEGSDKQAQNHLGFVLMGVRDLFHELMRERWLPGEEYEHFIDCIS